MAKTGSKAESTPMDLELVDVCRSFEGREVIQHVSLKIKEHEFFTLVGPSGSGKTTILKMLAGMDEPSSGDIVLGGRSICGLPPEKRPTCMVFQFLALFPHMTVGQNIEFPLRVKGLPADECYDRASRLLSLVRLPEDYYHKNVMKCSGGERQRVAIARALAYDPDILLFDEPLSAIDAKLRKTLQKELKALHEKTGKTFIYITHSLEEAMFMSDRVGVLNQGRLEQVGTPREIYDTPRSRFVASFIGDTNIFPAAITAGGSWVSSALPGVRLQLPTPPALKGYLIVRPEHLKLSSVSAQPEAVNSFEGEIVDHYSLGSRVQYLVRAFKQELIAETAAQDNQNLVSGARVRLSFAADDVIFTEV